MSDPAVFFAGMALTILAVFFFSLFHFTLGSYSKISLSRFLEDKDKGFRQMVIDRFEETRIAVEWLRTVLIIAFLVYLFTMFPLFRFRPLWLFILSLGIYAVFFDVLPRAIGSLGKNSLLKMFLPAFGLVRMLGAPVLAPIRPAAAWDDRNERDEERETTDGEIQTFIDEAREQGIIEQDEDGLLRNVVEFGDTIVREIMTPRLDMVCIRADATIDNLKDIIIREKYSRIPVYRDRLDNIEGIVIAKDLLEYLDEKHKTQSFKPLIRPVSFVTESMDVADLLEEFQKSKQYMAMVVDEHGGVSGLVTMEDVVEEIIGEIQDEYDVDEAQIRENGPLDFTVTGEVEVEELEELFDEDLAEDDFISVGGLVVHALGRFPKKGEILRIKGLAVEVLDVDDRKVRKLRIRRAAAPERREP